VTTPSSEKALDARDDALEREIFQRTRSLETTNRQLSRERDELESSNTRLKRLVDLDPVTGLANRESFASLVDSELRRSLREGRPVSVIAFGVDHFRELNRANGHDAADEALRTLGGVLSDVFRRAGDATGRLGSDRLGIVVPGAAHEAALRLAEKVRVQAHKLAMSHDAAPGADRVTVSAGCMTVEPRTRTDAETTLTTAEAALGVAQRQGGNRVVSDLLPQKGKASLRSVSSGSH
jgi:diguanylate cyclase (GGDEF)-like protein